MNPVFWFLVILIAVVLWFLLTFVFYPLGKFLWKIGSDTKYELEKEDNKDEEKGEKDKE